MKIISISMLFCCLLGTMLQAQPSKGDKRHKRVEDRRQAFFKKNSDLTDAEIKTFQDLRSAHKIKGIALRAGYDVNDLIAKDFETPKRGELKERQKPATFEDFIKREEDEHRLHMNHWTEVEAKLPGRALELYELDKRFSRELLKKYGRQNGKDRKGEKGDKRRKKEDAPDGGHRP